MNYIYDVMTNFQDKYYDFYNGELIEDVQKTPTAYYNIGDKFYNWGQIPLIPFKYNYLEMILCVLGGLL